MISQVDISLIEISLKKQVEADMFKQYQTILKVLKFYTGSGIGSHVKSCRLVDFERGDPEEAFPA